MILKWEGAGDRALLKPEGALSNDRFNKIELVVIATLPLIAIKDYSISTLQKVRKEGLNEGLDSFDCADVPRVPGYPGKHV
jgi:hypothetical protein